MRLFVFLTFLATFAVVLGNDEPCQSYPGECKPKDQCSVPTLAKIGGEWSCPKYPNNVECCPYKQEDPCSGLPGVCKHKGECPGGALAKIGGRDSCPSSPDEIECCPMSGANTGGGYTQDERCRNYPGVCKPKGQCSTGPLAKIDGHDSCPSSPDDIECCPTNGGGGGSGYKQDDRCVSYPGVCKPRGQCSTGPLAKINGHDSCPSSPDGIECCPNHGGGGSGGGNAIVNAARSQIGHNYIWGGGNKDGPSHGGFDCSGLTQYAVYQGTGRGKVIPRTADTQYNFGGCSAHPVGSRQAGDLIFWQNRNGHVYHVAVVSDTNRVIYAPEPGQKVKEGNLYNHGELSAHVRRC